MNVQKGRIVSGGRLLVPAAMRRQLGLADGDTVMMGIAGEELRVRPVKSAIRSAKGSLRRFAPLDGSVADELIAERRAESARE